MKRKVKRLTVGDLKKALENVPNNVPIMLASDTGVDQTGCEELEIIVTDAYRSKFNLPNGKVFEDTGTNGYDELRIYCNKFYTDEIELI